jgi:hypothetical protein
LVIFNRIARNVTPSIQTLSSRRPLNAAFGLMARRFETSLIHFGSFQ